MKDLTKKLIIACGVTLSAGGAVSMIIGTVAHVKSKKEEQDREYEKWKIVNDADAERYNRKRELEERELKDKEEYWSSMTSEDKAKVEVEKKKAEQEKAIADQKEADARRAEAETKAKLTSFKTDILDDVRKSAMDYVRSDSKDLFNSWASSYDSKIDRKIDKLQDKIDEKVDKDDLSSIKRRINRIEERSVVQTQNSVPSSGSSSPTITVAPVIGK